jgi:hypothetical protein
VHVLNFHTICAFLKSKIKYDISDLKKMPRRSTKYSAYFVLRKRHEFISHNGIHLSRYNRFLKCPKEISKIE